MWSDTKEDGFWLFIESVWIRITRSGQYRTVKYNNSLIAVFTRIKASVPHVTGQYREKKRLKQDWMRKIQMNRIRRKQ